MSDGPGRVIVLDDDPTGTQTVSDLPVVLTPDVATLTTLADRWAGPIWVLTNIRAMQWPAARRFLLDTVASIQTVFGPSVRLVLRGDSTLRGHVLDEIDTLAGPDSVALFVPAFLEQGRVTIDSVHFITVDGRRVAVAATEYARDPEFAYRHSNLLDWIADRDPARATVAVQRAGLRSMGAPGLAKLLLEVPAATVVVPDAETPSDLAIIATAWSTAQDRGRPVVLRCAASLAGVVAGSPPKPVVLDVVSGAVLVVCASYTSGASEQLAALRRRPGVVTHEVDIDAALGPGAGAYRVGLAAAVADSLRRVPVTVLATPRTPAERALSLAAGEQLMDTVVGVVGDLRGHFAGLVTKGGITSARIARDAVRAPVAYVRGQVLPGVPVWEMTGAGPGPADQLIQVVVPGNVGPPPALVDIVSQLVPDRQ